MAEYKITAAEHIDPEIQANAFVVCSIKYASPRHTHDFFEFFLIIRGRCLHKVNNGIQNLSEGTLVFIRPEDVHYYDYHDGEDCEFINIPCMKKVIKDAFHYLGDNFNPQRLLTGEMPPYAILSPLERENLLGRFERLSVLSTLNKSQASVQLRGMVAELLTQYFNSSTSINKDQMPLWFESLLTKMHKKENFTSGLARMYELSGRSVGHLNRVFKQYLASTPTAYINRLRLNYAKSLLLSTELSIVEISLEAGFDNLSHFYHLFKEHFNATPSELREKGQDMR